MKTIQSIVGDRETVTAGRLTSMKDAARVMSDRHIGAVPVLDGERLVGIVTERDVMARVVAAGRDPEATSAGDVMSTEPVVAEISDSYETCLNKMKSARVRHLILLDKGRLKGIVSLRDLMAVDIDEKQDALTLLNAYVTYIPADIHH